MNVSGTNSEDRPVALVFGKNGQLGASLQWQASSFPDIELRTFSRAEIAISDAAAVRSAIAENKPAVVINAAAYTAVDKAESDEEAAFTGNALGPWNLANECASAGIPLIHVSTDYVFSGENDRPWLPDDAVAPLGIYGRTKLAGEWAVTATQPDSYILRTSWVFSPWGNNFVKTMLRLGAERDELSIINDQHGCPTYAPDLAAAILEIARQRVFREKGRSGVYHFSNQGQTTWFDFAKAIFQLAEKSGRKTPSKLNPIPTSAYPTPAKRPKWSVMDLSSIEEEWVLQIPSWEDALARCMKALEETSELHKS